MDLAREFERRKPWVTQFVVNGTAYGGWYNAAADLRLGQFRTQFPEARRILELGSLEGGHSFALAASPMIDGVVAVEGRKRSLDRARFVQGVLGDRKVTFTHGSLETLDLVPLGRFDAVLCLGLLYHLPKPWTLVERMAAVADGVFLWTQYAGPRHARQRRGGYDGTVYREWRWLFEPLSGLSFTSFWPTLDELVRMLADHGFTKSTIVEDAPEHDHGPAITLAARKG
jgi:hypothetical protein